MTGYETELKDLANFVAELLGSEEVLSSKFETGLNLKFWERMVVTGNQSFKKVVQLALWAENWLKKANKFEKTWLREEVQTWVNPPRRA